MKKLIKLISVGSCLDIDDLTVYPLIAEGGKPELTMGRPLVECLENLNWSVSVSDHDLQLIIESIGINKFVDCVSASESLTK
jgi:hypothetical protein